MSGFVDYLRMGMGWWSTLPPAIVPIGSILVDTVDTRPAVELQDYAVPSITMDDWSAVSEGIEVGAVEMI